MATLPVVYYVITVTGYNTRTFGRAQISQLCAGLEASVRYPTNMLTCVARRIIPAHNGVAVSGYLKFLGQTSRQISDANKQANALMRRLQSPVFMEQRFGSSFGSTSSVTTDQVSQKTISQKVVEVQTPIVAYHMTVTGYNSRTFGQKERALVCTTLENAVRYPKLLLNCRILRVLSGQNDVIVSGYLEFTADTSAQAAVANKQAEILLQRLQTPAIVQRHFIRTFPSSTVTVDKVVSKSVQSQVTYAARRIHHGRRRKSQRRRYRAHRRHAAL